VLSQLHEAVQRVLAQHVIATTRLQLACRRRASALSAALFYSSVLCGSAPRCGARPLSTSTCTDLDAQHVLPQHHCLNHDRSTNSWMYVATSVRHKRPRRHGTTVLKHTNQYRYSTVCSTVHHVSLRTAVTSCSNHILYNAVRAMLQSVLAQLQCTQK
jgi:hypothetical protein